MKSVLISIQPKWCELIASGKKTIEVRKTRPKIDTLFKAYIYCTKSKDMLWVLNKNNRAFTDKFAATINAKDVGGAIKANGKVIGEFICDRIASAEYGDYVTSFSEDARLTAYDLLSYAKGKTLFGWHISELKIYDKPKELGKFKTLCAKNTDCYLCDRYDHIRKDCNSTITRPPQSWCYVEEYRI